VQEGPFVGTRLLGERSWGSGERAPKLLGCYEADLHVAIERSIAMAPEYVVNLGCAEGYYAVGLARRLPHAIVLAVDIDPRGLDVCRENARANGVADRVVLLRPDDLAGCVPADAHSLWVVDVEGAERDLLDASQHPALRHASIIVECHDDQVPGTSEALRDRFAASHDVTVVAQGARDPNRHEMLSSVPEWLRWQAVNEFRSCVMSWLVFTPRGGPQPIES